MVDYVYMLADECDLRTPTVRVTFAAPGSRGGVTVNLPIQHNSRGHLIKIRQRLARSAAPESATMSKEALVQWIRNHMRTAYYGHGAGCFIVHQAPVPPAVVAPPPAVVAPPPAVVPPQRFDEGVIQRLRPFIVASVATMTEENADVPGMALVGAVAKEEICPISWEPLKRETVCVTSCGHFFKKDALAMWREESNLCPVCRTSLRKIFNLK